MEKQPDITALNSGGGGGGGIKEVAAPEQQRQSPGGNNRVGERVKRDEWSEGAVSTLLEAYERKWVLRNRAKLKGHDWEDVAAHVSSRAGFTKSPKTQTQCKNKIESMKKRYRSESTADASSWPLFSRLDLLLRGNAPPPPPLPPPPPPPPLPVALPPDGAQNSHGSNGVDGEAKEDGAAINKNISLSDHASDKNNTMNNNNNNNNNSMEITSDSSTPALYSEKADKSRSRKTTIVNQKTRKMKRKVRRDGNDNDDDNDNDQELGIAESIRWLAEAVVKSEQARMEATREIEKMRAEAEAKRAEIDLKRTEIVANTQLEIAKIFAGVLGNNNNDNNNNNNNKPVDSSLRIGRN